MAVDSFNGSGFPPSFEGCVCVVRIECTLSSERVEEYGIVTNMHVLEGCKRSGWRGGGGAARLVIFTRLFQQTLAQEKSGHVGGNWYHPKNGCDQLTQRYF